MTRTVVFTSVLRSVWVSMHVFNILYSLPSFILAKACRSSEAFCGSGNDPE